MQQVDLNSFQKLMAEVQEVYGHRPPSPAVLQHWVDALKSHPFHTIDSVLRNWIQTKPKAPVIADITKLCADILSDRIEARAEADRKAFQVKPEEWKGATPYAEQCIAEIRALLAKPKPHPKAWAVKIMQNPNSTHAQRDFAKPVYEQLMREGSPLVTERVPGEDDEMQEAA